MYLIALDLLVKRVTNVYENNAYKYFPIEVDTDNFVVK